MLYRSAATAGAMNAGRRLQRIIRSADPLSELPAISGPKPAIDDALAEVVAKVVVVTSPGVEEHVTMKLIVDAQLGTDEHAILGTPAGDIADMRTDKGLPSPQVPNVADTRQPSGAPAVLSAGADGVEQYPVCLNDPVRS